MVHAEMMRRWVEKQGDAAFAKELDAWLAAGAKAMEDHLWTGNYYRLYNEPETGRHKDPRFVPQLDGQLYARLDGLPGVFPHDHVEKVLELIREGSDQSNIPERADINAAASVVRSGHPNILKYPLYRLKRCAQ